MVNVIITAGGTTEKIDNVRNITNFSSGKLGMVIANHILNTRQDVFIYYICAKGSLRPISDKTEIIEIEGTIELKNKIENLLINKHIDLFIHSMAVSDYMVNYITTIEKIKESIERNADLGIAFDNVDIINDNKISSYEKNLVVCLKPTPKIISMIKDLSPSTFLVGFKLLDGVSKENLIEIAIKLRDKNKCDLVVANDLSSIRNGNHVGFIIDQNNVIETAVGKDEIARKLVNKINVF